MRESIVLLGASERTELGQVQPPAGDSLGTARSIQRSADSHLFSKLDRFSAFRFRRAGSLIHTRLPSNPTTTA